MYSHFKINIILAFFDLCFIGYGLFAKYLGLLYLQFVFILIIVSIFWFRQFVKSQIIFNVLMCIITICLFYYLFYPKYILNVERIGVSKNEFLMLPDKKIKEIKIVANLQRKNNIIKIKITNPAIISEILKSISDTREVTEYEIKMRDYFAITFLYSNDIRYSIALKAKCYINSSDGELCNLIYIRKNFQTDVFEEKHPEYGGDIMYMCKDLNPILYKYIDALLLQNPGQLYFEIK